MAAVEKYNSTLNYDKCFLGNMLLNYLDILLVK